MSQPMGSSAAPIERTIQVNTHGRYLIVPARAPASPLLVGFHGYAESAEIQMTRLRAIQGCDSWTSISIQGLHRFYERRTETVIASWMTRQDRQLAIADNAAYVSKVVSDEWSATQGARGVVYAGFSQGAAMAFRAAITSSCPVLGVIAAGGDVPPEIDRSALGRIGHVLLCHGTRDNWYTDAKFAEDSKRLRQASVSLTALEFAGGHEWSAPVVDAAGVFLADRLR
jgi:predicted esterase